MNKKTIQDKLKEAVIIPEGTSVTLNINKIKSHPDYPRFTEKYKQWIDKNKNNVFTVMYDDGRKIDPTLVCLNEDKSDPKWLFWTGDLVVIKS